MEYLAYMLDVEFPEEMNILLDNLIRMSDIVFDPSFSSSPSSSSPNGSSSERSRSFSPPRRVPSPLYYVPYRSRSAQPTVSSYITYDDLTKLSDEERNERTGRRRDRGRSISKDIKGFSNEEMRQMPSTSAESLRTFKRTNEERRSSPSSESDLRGNHDVNVNND